MAGIASLEAVHAGYSRYETSVLVPLVLFPSVVEFQKTGLSTDLNCSMLDNRRPRTLS